jgi:hypothetical protein
VKNEKNPPKENWLSNGQQLTVHGPQWIVLTKWKTN